jgi:hypothetical protein
MTDSCRLPARLAGSKYNLSYMVGWSFYLMNLRSVFESGYDLREKERRLTSESQNYTLER